MADYDLELKAIAKEIGKVKKLFSPATQTAIMTATAKKVGVKAERVALPKYPPQTGKPLAVFYTRIVEAKRPYKTKDGQRRRPGDTFQSKFKSRKQQGYVFRLGRLGGIPRKRTGTLGKTITSKVVAVTPTSAEIAVGTNTRYAPYVIDRDRQSNYHKGNWPTIQDNLETGMKDIERVAIDTYIAEVAKRVK